MKNFSFTKDNADSFSETIQKGPSFILIYTPGCGWCKKILPTWDKLETKFANEKYVGNIIKVNVEEIQKVDAGLSCMSLRW